MPSPSISKSALQAALASALALSAVGCDQPTGSSRPKARVSNPESQAQAPTPPPESPPSEVVAPRPILGQTTDKIRDTSKETAPGAGGVVASSRIVSKDPITLPGNAYVSIVGQFSVGQIKHAVDLYQAETGEYPKTYDEFMEKIIKANNIRLPELAYYREYAYDAANHQLNVIEYPDRMKQANDPRAR